MSRVQRVLVGLLSVVAVSLSACGGASHPNKLSLTTTSTSTSTITSTQSVVVPPVGETCDNGGQWPQCRDPQLFEKGLPPSAPLRTLPVGPTVTSTVEQFDDVTVSLIPAGSMYVAGYANGTFANTTAMHAAFPTAAIKSISVTASEPAECLDIEPRDATASQAAGWYRLDIAHGFKKPCFYAPESFFPAIFENLTAANISRVSYWAWSAHWTNVPHIDPGFDGTQWTETALGRSLDQSTLSLAFARKLVPKPVNLRHWDWLPDTRRTFKVNGANGLGPIKVTARERSAVRNWDRWGCKIPVRRVKCTTMNQHIELLAGRVYGVAHHTPDLKHKVKHPRWSAPHYKSADDHLTTLGGAYFQLSRRTSRVNHGVVTSWVPAKG